MPILKLDFDESLPKINVIPQDIGRVLLNLINNAFYAVDKKSKELTPLIPPKGGLKNRIQYKLYAYNNHKSRFFKIPWRGPG